MLKSVPIAPAEQTLVTRKQPYINGFEKIYLVLGIISIFPLFIYTDFHLEGTTLEQSLNDPNARLAFGASIGVATPLIMDIILDLLSPLPSNNVLSRFVLVLSLAIPNLIYLFGTLLPTKAALTFAVANELQRILSRGAMISIYGNLSTAVFKSRQMGIFLFLFVLIQFLDMFGLAIGDHGLRVSAVIIRYILFAFTIFSFIKWMREMFVKYFECKLSLVLKNGLKNVNTDDYLTFVGVNISTMNVISQALLPIIGGDKSLFFIEDYTPNYLIAYTITMSVFTLLSAMIPNRLSMYNSFALQQELDQRRTFVRHISHEVRTPLNSATIGISILEEKLKTLSNVDTCTMSLIEDIKEATQDAVKILTGILDYERLGAGLMKLERKWMNILPILEKVIHSFTTQASTKQLTLDFDSSQCTMVACETWQVNIDKHKISQVVRNFVSNAIKFSPSSSNIKIIASIHHSVKRLNTSTFRLEVLDNGPGIPVSDLDKIFNTVVQIQPNRMQEGGGSGIGLWVSKKIIDLHDGKVSVQSVEGQGSTFAFELSAKKIATTDEVNSDDAIVQNAAQNQAALVYLQNLEAIRQETILRPLHILVVDDSRLNRKMICRMVETKGYSFEEAGDGYEALLCYENSLLEGHHKFDVIFMDNSMPVMTGRVATRELRKRGCHAVIIGITGDALKADMDEFTAHGVDAVLMKPVDIAELENTIYDLLNKKKKLIRREEELNV